MEYFLGIDIGTTAVKTVAFSSAGKVLGEQSCSYSMLHPMPGWSEQDPEEIAGAVFKCVENILQHFRHPPQLISFSAAMHSLIAVDEEGLPLSNCLIWADNRADGIAGRIIREQRAESYYQKTGVRVHAMSPFCKLLWWRENDPLLFKKASRFIGIKEYIFLRLFGVYAVDSSIAAATGLMNMHTIAWDEEILEETGIGRDRLSRIVSAREIFTSPRLFPALKSVPFVIGGSDGAMANLGASSNENGALVVSIGTSSAVRVIVQGPEADPQMRSFCYHIRDNEYLLGGASNNGAVVLQWLREHFMMAPEKMPEFLSLAAGVNPGSDGLIFLPYILGERAPIWNASAKGVLFGLTVNHTRAHAVRAAMESVIHCVFAIAAVILEKRNIRVIHVTGGFAQNELWVQMLSDVFNLPVKVSETVENAAWGSVKLGMEALKMDQPGEAAILKTFAPVIERHRLYRQAFKKFERLYDVLINEF
jgi:gluconokinase